jgi:septum formation protein
MAQKRSRLKLILASASPRRRVLLRRLEIPFRVIASHVSEASSLKTPVRLVRELALRKALSVAKQLKEGVVLGADTVVVSRGKILGKPDGIQGAYRMLSRLSGTLHKVYTGIAIVDVQTRKSRVAHEQSFVRMRKLSSRELAHLSHQHHDKAGAYAIQEKHDPIARVVKGHYDNVVGLPVTSVRKLLRGYV